MAVVPALGPHAGDDAVHGVGHLRLEHPQRPLARCVRGIEVADDDTLPVRGQHVAHQALLRPGGPGRGQQSHERARLPGGEETFQDVETERVRVRRHHGITCPGQVEQPQLTVEQFTVERPRPGHAGKGADQATGDRVRAHLALSVEDPDRAFVDDDQQTVAVELLLHDDIGIGEVVVQ